MSDFGEFSRAATIALTPAGSVHWLAILLDAAVKGLVVLVVAAGATGLLRRTSAAVRHMVWTLSVIGLLCVPVLSIALPRLQVPLLPGWARPAIQTPAPLPPPSQVQAPGVAKGPSASPIDEPPAMLPSAHDVADNQDSPALLPSGIGAQQPAPAVPAATAQPQAKTPTHWSTWILLGWAAGVLVLAVPLLIGTVMMWRMTRQAARVTDGSWPVLLKGLCRDLGLRRPVTLLRSAGSNIPLTCGLLRPVIVLPAEADDWPADRRKVVLLHELAHVKRADCLTQLIARAARVLYWFNPLVHLACRMLRIERERACDDLVLASGHKASDYASHLLEIVRTLRSMRCPSLAAVAMARPCSRLRGRKSQFEGRLLAILDPRRNRRALTRLGLLIAAILVAAFVVPLSIIKATAADKPATANPAETATQPAAQPAGASDERGVIVELALRVLKAIREDDINTLKALSAGADQGWLEVNWKKLARTTHLNFQGEPPVGWSVMNLTDAAAEIRKDVFAKNPDAVSKVTETAIQGDYAATRTPVTGSTYLVLVFVRTSQGWRFATLDDGRDSLEKELAKHMANIPKNLMILRKLSKESTTQPATQPAPATQPVAIVAVYRAEAFLSVKSPVPGQTPSTQTVQAAHGEARTPLLSAEVLMQVVEAIDKTRWYVEHSGQGSDVIQELRKAIQVKPIPDTNLISLSMTGNAPEEIAQIVNAVAKAVAANDTRVGVRLETPVPSKPIRWESKSLMPPATQPAGSTLEFRIAPSPSALDKAKLSSHMNWLRAGRVGFWWKGGRIRGQMPDHAWLPIVGELTEAPGLVTGEYEGRKYLLVSDKPGQTMLPGDGKDAWGLAKVYTTTDNSGRPAVGFELDDRGAELFTALTKANVGNALAMVVDGKVVSAPVLKTALGKQGMITGRFSEQEVAALVTALKAGMPPNAVN